jgi:hypothetical protein
LYIPPSAYINSSLPTPNSPLILATTITSNTLLNIEWGDERPTAAAGCYIGDQINLAVLALMPEAMKLEYFATLLEAAKASSKRTADKHPDITLRRKRLNLSVKEIGKAPAPPTILLVATRFLGIP